MSLRRLTGRGVPGRVARATSWLLTLVLLAVVLLTPRVPVLSFETGAAALTLQEMAAAFAVGVLAVALWLSRRVNARLCRMAGVDTVTGLPNRRAFDELLARSVAAARRRDRSVGVVLIDLDHFKAVNDSFGHHYGDRFLEHVAKRLLDAVRTTDTVARYGGDEFGLILPQMQEPQEAVSLAERLVEAFESPVRLGGHAASVSCSVGVSLFPGDGGSAEELTRSADAALYRAKSEGGGRLQLFDASIRAWVRERRELERDLCSALSRDELTLHYQPQVSLDDGRVVGVEALARWEHPVKGAIPPDVFIPLAEEAGLIPTLGAWVIEQACRQSAEWQRQGLPRVPVSVNVSLRQIHAGNLAVIVKGALELSGLAPASLCLEINDKEGAAHPEKVVRYLDELGEAGVKLTMDDFGLGHSPLSKLLRYPLGALKIDDSFVAEIPGNRHCAAIVCATVALAKELGLKVIAEGIETEEQLGFLCDKGCDTGQGFLFGRPEPAERFAALLRRPRRPVPAPLEEAGTAPGSARRRRQGASPHR